MYVNYALFHKNNITLNMASSKDTSLIGHIKIPLWFLLLWGNSVEAKSPRMCETSSYSLINFELASYINSCVYMYS